MLSEHFQGWIETLSTPGWQDMVLILLAILCLALIIYHSCGSCKKNLHVQSDDAVSEDMESVLRFWEPETTMIDFKTRKLTLVRGDVRQYKVDKSTIANPKEEAELKSMLQENSTSNEMNHFYQVKNWTGQTKKNSPDRIIAKQRELFPWYQSVIDQLKEWTT
jgi:hypothetical protein